MIRSDSQDGSSGPLDSILPILEACGVEVLDLDEAYVTCPGIEAHTTPNAKHDCIAYNNSGIPFLHCVHQSCRPARKEANAKLLKFARGSRPDAGRTKETAAEREQREAYAAKSVVAERERKLAAAMLPAILREYDWSAEAIVASSPERIALPVGQHWQLLLCLFDEDDVVWIGRDQLDSGSPKYHWRFCRSLDWLSFHTCPGQFTCPSAFRPGAYQRERKDVLTPKFLVVESDTLSRDQVGAVFRWIERSLNLPLRAVVDSGNKSLHGWFEYPSPAVFEKLRLWLPAMGCDPAMFKPNQPCRLPGAWRAETGRFQRLLYIA